MTFSTLFSYLFGVICFIQLLAFRKVLAIRQMSHNLVSTISTMKTRKRNTN